jgi:hypothetical protein
LGTIRLGIEIFPAAIRIDVYSMRLLSETQVKFQKVINLESKQPRPSIGILYEEKLFKKIKFFAKHRADIDRQISHQLSIESKIACFLLESESGYTVWYHDRSLASYQSDRSNDWIDKINLAELVKELRGAGGIDLQDRQYRMLVYKRCAIGSEVTDWLRERFDFDRDDAIKLGQRLIVNRLLHHVTDDHDFQDGYFFYRFYCDE